MDMRKRIEQALERQLAPAPHHGAPPKLLQAMRHAVFPGGARIRPQLCLAVAQACACDAPGLALGGAVGVELLHCASLVHDDMPCFDDADTRRGRPSVQRQYGEPLALLTGDALIVLAFEVLTGPDVGHAERALAMQRTLAQAAGSPAGVVAGQAWECETEVDLSQYQRAKTGALFVAATTLGAQAAGATPEPWQALGEQLGEASQVADDIRDVVGDAAELGKPVGQDQAHDRPNAMQTLGLSGALKRFESLMQDAVAAVPACPQQSAMRELVRHEALRLVPQLSIAWRHPNPRATA